MKFIVNILTISCLYIAAVWGQSTHIVFPLAGATLHLNRNFTVQLVRPNSIQGSTEVGIAIGLVSCPVSQGACPPPSARLGSILYTGPFTPTIHPMAQFYENFTLTVPEFLATGRAQLAVVRLHLIGAGASPILEFNNITVNLAH
ncbi:hypothetical protein DFH08DRAFT_1005689 [Mycena albidolilacea]|uniref:Uncharacterized protein n=1 Tax=Mycena albidolilacea TaxID=1033008 RepID=A0AAD7AT33_9AGAR|nr:hypothetical protein DFH08DRAFT_1005689 [Mycena albidolilacea]